MLPHFQLNCINAQDDCLICLTEVMGPSSVHLTSHKQFNPSQIVNLASYSPLRNFMDDSNTDFFLLNIVEILRLFSNFKKLSSCLQLMFQENFRLSEIFLTLKKLWYFASFSEQLSKTTENYSKIFIKDG